MFDRIDEMSVNAIRALSIDMIENAKSGHPGLPLDAAPMGYVLWAKQMKFNPKDTHWINRDRFILSAGHGSALLYSLLHLVGSKVSIEDLKRFKTYSSNTPGHPEYGVTEGGMPVPVRSAKGSAWHLAWQWLKSIWPPDIINRISRL